jgi:hypothetical protein
MIDRFSLETSFLAMISKIFFLKELKSLLRVNTVQIGKKHGRCSLLFIHWMRRKNF